MSKPILIHNENKQGAVYTDGIMYSYGNIY